MAVYISHKRSGLLNKAINNLPFELRIPGYRQVLTLLQKVFIDSPL